MQTDALARLRALPESVALLISPQKADDLRVLLAECDRQVPVVAAAIAWAAGYYTVAETERDVFTDAEAEQAARRVFALLAAVTAYRAAEGTG